METEQKFSTEIFATSTQIAQYFLKESKDDQSKFLWSSALSVLQSLSKSQSTAQTESKVSNDNKGNQPSQAEGVKKIISQGLSLAAKSGSLGELGKSITPEAANSIADSIAAGIEIASKATTGEISSNEFAERIAKVVGVGLLGTAGKIVGQTLIPIPGLGAAIGSLVGTLMGQVAYHGIKFTINRLDDPELWNRKIEISAMIIQSAQKAQQLCLIGAKVETAQQQLLQDLDLAVKQWAQDKEKFDSYYDKIKAMQGKEKERIGEIKDDLDRIQKKLQSR